MPCPVHDINFFNENDTELYIVVSPDDTSPIEALHKCILEIKPWMTQNFFQLNQDKTGVHVIGAGAHREELTRKLKSLALRPRHQI